ncbi:hypothetical protein IFM89_019208 [Coptis chinensis]|uniref:Ubiquitin-like domain-containing protein n=1 Tax=Coptis chinensis TaxID=261450 RepID=A0A835M0M5_9MAGN|nr:hypothetical protein IFM89_019208 [Coptis chinensis]
MCTDSKVLGTYYPQSKFTTFFNDGIHVPHVSVIPGSATGGGQIYPARPDCLPENESDNNLLDLPNNTLTEIFWKMGSNGADEVMVDLVDEAECSETTVEIKIKTLDSQTYTLRVNKRVPVPELKEQIQTVTGVVSEQQRLICRGKVLKDDQLLSAYHVEDGHTLHLVVRQPIPPSSESSPDNPASDSAGSAGQNGGAHIAHRVLLGSFNIADQGDGGIPDLNRIISAVLSSIGLTSIGGSTEGTDHMEPGPDGLERTSGASAVSDSNQPQPDQPTARLQFDPLLGAFRMPSTASLGSVQPPVIPDSLTTLVQYIRHLRQEFSPIGTNQSNPAVDASQSTAVHSDAGQVGLPTAASLAEVMLSARQLLTEQVGERLLQLARQLEDQANVTSSSWRNSLQTSAMRTGISLQNLGALLLELGRTTMTLRMGQTPSDAVVNAGPAVFISTSGPNPIMVQPLQPGASFGAAPMGAINAGSGLLGGTIGSGLFPRNIDIRIRAGPSLSTGNANQGEQVSSQQIPGQSGPERGPSSASSIQPQGAAVTGGPSFSGETGVRVLPIRTVVAAVPASISRSTSNSSGMGLFYPLLARVQHMTPGLSNDARGAQSSSEPRPGAPVRDGNPETAGLQTVRTASTVSELNPANVVFQLHQQGTVHIPASRRQDPVNSHNNTQPSSEIQNGQESASQIPGSDQLPTESVNATQEGNNVGADSHDTEPRLGFDEGIFLSRILHQIMPVISQISVPEQNDGSDNQISHQSTSQTAEEQPEVEASHHRDDCPPTPPNSKRQKVVGKSWKFCEVRNINDWWIPTVA